MISSVATQLQRDVQHLTNRRQKLKNQVTELQDQVEELRSYRQRLADTPHYSEGQLKLEESTYSFASDEDSEAQAFDAFFATPDPHIDKVRQFLLG